MESVNDMITMGNMNTFNNGRYIAPPLECKRGEAFDKKNGINIKNAKMFKCSTCVVRMVTSSESILKSVRKMDSSTRASCTAWSGSWNR